MNPTGVYRDEEMKLWTWACTCGATAGAPVGSRDAARTAYREHRKTCGAATSTPAVAPPAESTTPTEEEAPAVEKPAPAPTGQKKEKKMGAKKTSRAAAKAPRKEGAVAKVWAIANKMKGKARKDVIDACVKAGINVNTAKTQYQRWLHRGEE